MAKTTSKKTVKKPAQKSPSKKSVTPLKSTSLKSTSLRSTARASQKAVAKRAGKPVGEELMGLSLTPWITQIRFGESDASDSGRTGFVLAFGANDAAKVREILMEHLPPWALDSALVSAAEFQFFHGEHGPVWLLRAHESAGSGPLDKSDFARFRDLGGAVVPQLHSLQLDELILEFHDMSFEEEHATFVGLEMARYSYVENRGNPRKPRRRLPQLRIIESSTGSSIDERESLAMIESAAQLAMSVNIARHLVNLPGGDLHPRAYAEAVQKLFSRSRTVEIEVWEGAKLERERMNLMLAVGSGAEEGPRLVHIKYRPQNSVLARPIAIVGKGVTFDSGGLDIKPSGGMRLMKKDMGGSAAAVAIARWAEMSELPVALDIYLAIAENAISGSAFRPGDVITARNGLTIEIHNTDAEGRLVLADALDVAVSQKGKDEPLAVINIATLTGAIKVGLGGEIAGLFSNHDGLAEEIEDAGRARGDLSWRMPLFAPYRSQLRSTFADYANSADGFGGAITAALFLELFVKGKPWAHLDVYAWRDSAGGAWSEAGGNGQPVMALTELLSRFANGHIPAEFTDHESAEEDLDERFSGRLANDSSEGDE